MCGRKKHTHMRLVQLLQHVGGLANPVTRRDARDAVLRARAASPALLAHPQAFAQVHARLALYRLPLPARRFMHELLDAGAPAFAPPGGAAREARRRSSVGINLLDPSQGADS